MKGLRLLLLMVAALIVGGTSQAYSQSFLKNIGKSIENRTKRKIEDSVNRQVQKGLNKVEDSAEKTASKAVKREKKTKEAEAPTATAPTPKNDCVVYFPTDVGITLEYTLYNGQDEVMGFLHYTVKDVNSTPEGLVITTDCAQLDKDGNEVASESINMYCENGQFYADLKNVLDPNSLNQFKGMEIDVIGTPLMYPAVMNVGTTLPDSKVELKLKGMQGRTILSAITKDCKVEAVELLTTPAGSFECYRISYNNVMAAFGSEMEMKTTQWIAKDIGIVRTDILDKEGQVTAKQVLTKKRI